jgi:hypothetical protein
VSMSLLPVHWVCINSEAAVACEAKNGLTLTLRRLLVEAKNGLTRWEEQRVGTSIIMNITRWIEPASWYIYHTPILTK